MDIPIYPNFPVLVPLGRGRVYADILHALGMGEYGPILFDFRLTPTASTSYTLADLQQDTMLGARLWGLKELANEMPHELVIFYFGIASGIKVRTLSLYCKSEHNSFTAQHFINMSHIMDGIIKQVSYPSRRPDCQYCIHKEKCDAIMNQGGSNYDKVCK